MQDLSLARLDEVLKAIEAATTVQEIKGTIDAAKAVEVYTKQAKVGKDIELKAAEYIVRAERKLGEMLAAAKAAGQITFDHGNQYKRDVPNENTPKFTLEEAGIDRKLSSEAQKLAAIPQKDFEKKISASKEAGKLTAKIITRSDQSNGQAHHGEKKHAPTPHPRRTEFVALSDAGLTNPEIAEKTGISVHSIRREIEREQIKRETQPQVTPEMLSLTAQQKLDLATKQHKEKLDAEFGKATYAAAMELLQNTIGPRLKKEQEEAKRIMKARDGIMTRKEYIKIRSCLHPDRVTDPQLKQVFNEAYLLCERLEKRLLNEKESPTDFVHLPATAAEWAEAKRQASKQKADRRQKGTGIQTK